jgi:polyhydroxyalkanoate synthesis regulator protein
MAEYKRTTYRADASSLRAAAPPNTRAFVRYPSARRIYDLNLSRYITMLDMHVIIKAGADVVVYLYPSGSDITTDTLLDILVAREKRRPHWSQAELITMIRG